MFDILFDFWVGVIFLSFGFEKKRNWPGLVDQQRRKKKRNRKREINNENVVVWRESIRNELLQEMKEMISDNNQNISEAVDERMRENKEEKMNRLETNNNEIQNKLSEMMKVSTQLFKLMGDFNQKN